MPAGKEYKATLTDLDVSFVDISPHDIENRASRLKSLQEAIKETESELAKLKR